MATKPLPDVETLRKLLDYDPETGVLTWKPRPVEMFASQAAANKFNAQWAGREALTASDKDGYKTGDLLYIFVRAHRVAWAIQTGAWPKAKIDHINGIPWDNRFANLREATSVQNAQNKRSKSGSTSAFLGVSWDRRTRRWRAGIKAFGKSISIGQFDSEQDAAKAYDAEAIKHHGVFARLNFPGE